MPQQYSRSRARFQDYNEGNNRGYYRKPSGGNSLMKALLGVVVVAAVVLAGVVFWKPISEVFHFGGAAEPTPTPVITEEPTPPPTEEPTPSPTLEDTATPEPSPTPEPEPTPEPFLDFTVTAVGDLILESSLLTDAKDRTSGEYDFMPFFANIKEYLTGADLTIGTLESTLAGKDATYSGTTRYNTPESILPALADAGFDVLSTAHTHIFDKGYAGMQKTMEAIEAAGMRYAGTYLSSADYHNKIQYVTLGSKNVTAAVLAYSGDEKYKNSIPAAQMDYAIKHINLTTIRADVKKAKEEGANIVIVMMHWGGSETNKTTTDTIREQAKEVIKAGADLIIGSHPYFLHKIEKISVNKEDGTKAEGIVAYSLGSFLSAQTSQYKDTGLILNVTFRKDTATGAVTIQNATYSPTYLYCDPDRQYSILPVGRYKDNQELLEGIKKASARTRITKAWDEVIDLLKEDVAQPTADPLLPPAVTEEPTTPPEDQTETEQPADSATPDPTEDPTAG